MPLSANQILVRESGPADIPAITAIYKHAVLHGTGTFEIEPPDETEMAARHGRMARGGYPFLVACAAGEVIGYAYANAYRDRPAYRFTVEDSIYIRLDWHGRGVGAILIERLIAASEVAGFRQMIAVIGDSGNLGSIRLHARAGFAPVGTLRSSGWKAGHWLDVVLMQRALGAGDGTAPDETR